jgi:hypothetical protein
MSGSNDEPRDPTAGARFNTITGADWQRSLISARERRKSEKTRIQQQIKHTANPSTKTPPSDPQP